MPAGLLLLNAAGLVTSANPAAELALGVKSLPYRRYTEVLGAGSRLTELIAKGCTSSRDEPSAAKNWNTSPRRTNCGNWAQRFTGLGNSNEVTGAICLLSDPLTELAWHCKNRST